jgi:hypothetical protein
LLGVKCGGHVRASAENDEKLRDDGADECSQTTPWQERQGQSVQERDAAIRKEKRSFQLGERLQLEKPAIWVGW